MEAAFDPNLEKAWEVHTLNTLVKSIEVLVNQAICNSLYFCSKSGNKQESISQELKSDTQQ